MISVNAADVSVAAGTAKHQSPYSAVCPPSIIKEPHYDNFQDRSPNLLDAPLIGLHGGPVNPSLPRRVRCNPPARVRGHLRGN